jgi:hypothetical protein
MQVANTLAYHSTEKIYESVNWGLTLEQQRIPGTNTSLLLEWKNIPKYQVMYDTRTTAYTSNKHSSLVLKRKTIRNSQVMYDNRTTAYTSHKHSSLLLKRKHIKVS